MPDHPLCPTNSEIECEKCRIITNQLNEDLHNLLYTNPPLRDKVLKAIKEGKHFRFILLKTLPEGEKRLEKKILLFCPTCNEQTIHNSWIQGKHSDATYRHCYECTSCGYIEQWAQPEDKKLGGSKNT